MDDQENVSGDVAGDKTAQISNILSSTMDSSYVRTLPTMDSYVHTLCCATLYGVVDVVPSICFFAMPFFFFFFHIFLLLFCCFLLLVVVCKKKS